MPMWTCFDGSTHPVSDGFMSRVHLDLNGKSYAQLRTELDGLLGMSGRDVLEGGRELTAVERARVEAITHVLNLNRALAFLSGRDYREIFGPDATLDQVHGNRFSPDTCNCILQNVFDHNRRGEGGIEVHPHHAHSVCAVHEHHGQDFRACHADVMGENAHKNLVVEKHATELGVERPEIAWRFDSERHLVIAHPKIATGAYEHEGKTYRAEPAR